MSCDPSAPGGAFGARTLPRRAWGGECGLEGSQNPRGAAPPRVRQRGRSLGRRRDPLRSVSERARAAAGHRWANERAPPGVSGPVAPRPFHALPRRLARVRSLSDVLVSRGRSTCHREPEPFVWRAEAGSRHRGSSAVRGWRWSPPGPSRGALLPHAPSGPLRRGREPWRSWTFPPSWPAARKGSAWDATATAWRPERPRGIRERGDSPRRDSPASAVERRGRAGRPTSARKNSAASSATMRPSDR